MRKVILILFVIGFLSVACSTTKKVTQVNSPGIASVENDGSSFEKAIVIKEEHETPGIHAEYAWIRNKYPGSKTNGQALSYHDKKPYDIINITTADNTKIEVYFDISNFYGKF